MQAAGPAIVVREIQIAGAINPQAQMHRLDAAQHGPELTPSCAVSTQPVCTSALVLSSSAGTHTASEGTSHDRLSVYQGPDGSLQEKEDAAAGMMQFLLHNLVHLEDC